MMNRIAGHHRIGLRGRHRPVRIRDFGDAWDVAQRREVARDENAADPRQGPRGFDAGHREFRVSVRAAQERGVERALGRVVGGEGALPAHQANVLDALDRLTDAEFHRSHGFSLVEFRHGPARALRASASAGGA